MKQITKHRLLPLFFVLFAVVSIFPHRVHAVAGSVYFTPNGGSVRMGDQITVEVRGNVPDPGLWGGGATIVVNYDASKLELVDRNDSGGAFRGANSRNWDGTKTGTVRYVAYYAINAPGVKNTKIISMEFRAISTGSAPLSFGTINVNNGPTTGTNSTFNIIPLTCPAGQIGTPPNCSTPPPPSPSPTPKPTTPSTPSTRPTPTPSPVVTVEPPVVDSTESTPDPEVASDGGLKIEDVKATTTRQKNSVTWKLNRDNITPTIAFGTSKNAVTKAAETKLLEDGSYEAEFADLKPGTLYHFTIKAASSDSLQGATHSGTLTTRGYPVQLTIQQNGVLAPGAKAVINQRTFTANKDALIATELGEGQFTASITPSGSSTAHQVAFAVAKKTIPASGNPALQAFTLNAIIDGAGSDENDDLLLAIGGVIGGLGLIGGVIGFLIFKRRQREASEETGVDQDLLIANYGSSLETFRETAANTPTPNLEAAPYSPSQETPQVEQLNDSVVSAQPLDAQPITPPEQSFPEPTLPPSIDIAPPAFDPVGLPLPSQSPAPEQYVDQVAQQQVPPTYTEEEQSSPELAQIESLQVPENDEPSAIYDATTGELDIIHHHADTVTPVQPPIADSANDATQFSVTHTDEPPTRQPLNNVAAQQ